MAIYVDLALSNVHPPQSSPLKSHRGCPYAVSNVYSIIDIGQAGQNGKEVRRSASLEEGDVHECIEADIAHSWVDWGDDMGRMRWNRRVAKRIKIGRAHV